MKTNRIEQSEQSLKTAIETAAGYYDSRIKNLNKKQLKELKEIPAEQQEKNKTELNDLKLLELLAAHFNRYSGHCCVCHKPLEVVYPHDTKEKAAIWFYQDLSGNASEKLVRWTACEEHQARQDYEFYSERTCLCCGVVFISSGRSVFCSKACKDEYLKNNKPQSIGEKQPITAICQRCGNSFQSMRVDAKYCGNACRTAAHRKKQVNAEQATEEEKILNAVSVTS